MIVDFHTHTFPDKIAERALEKLRVSSHTRSFADGTAGDLKQSRVRAGIDRCVVLPVATDARQVIHINDAALRTNETAGETGIWSLGAMHPAFEDWHAELGRLAGAGIRGIKLHPPYQGTPMDDKSYLRILTRAGELGLFVLIHAGLDVGLPGDESAVPERVASALRQAGPVRLVCAHMGGWRCWDRAAELLPDLGVWIDTAFSLGPITPLGDGYPWTEESLSMLDESAFLRVVKAFGTDRVLFGTDSPWMDQSDQLRRIRALPLAQPEQDTVLGGNACQLMGW